MIRKALTGLCLLSLGSYLWLGTSMGSYATTGYNNVTGYFKGQVPIEFELERARQLAREIVPDLQKTRRSVAEEEVRIARLEREIGAANTQLAKEQEDIVKIKSELQKGLTTYKYGSATYSATTLRADLNRRFNSYQRAQAAVDAKQAVLDSRMIAMNAAQQKVMDLMAAKDQLEAEIASLEARHKMIEAKKVSNKFQIDDSKLGEVRQAIEEIRDRLSVEEKLSEEHGNVAKRVPVEEIPPADLFEKIDKYFDKDAATVETDAVSL